MSTTRSSFVIWRTGDVPNACVLERPEGIERLWELTEGVPRARTFPEDATFSMDSDSRYDTLLTDSLDNISMLIVGSLRLKKFLDEWELHEVEYLPVTIIDHKGRPVKSQYYIINPIHPVDCLVLDECGVRWSALDEDAISKIERIVIDESKIGAERSLFRANHLESVIFARRDLAEAIDAEGFTGIRWIELSDYPE